MDKQYSVKFFTSFVEAMQKFCRDYIDFEQCVELSGYLAVEIDNHKKERYVLSEMLQISGNVISESYCTKAFKTLRKEPTVSASRGSENIVPTGAPRSSHSDEVTIVLRDSPDRMSSHSTPRHHRFSSHRSGGFSQGQRGFSSSSRLVSPVHARESVKLGNPFEQQLGQPSPDQIQPRSMDSATRNNSFPSSSVTAQKRTSTDQNHQQGSPAAKRDKTEPGSSSPTDVSSMRSGYSEGGDTSHTQQTSSVSFPSPNPSQSTGESIRLPLSATVKEEDVISLDTQDNSQQQADTDFGDQLQDSMSLGLDTSTSYANSSQGAMDDTSQSAMSASYMSQYKWHKRPYRSSYSHKDIEMAVTMVVNKQANLSTASKMCRVPIATLHRHVRRRIHLKNTK